ncbi:MAG: hypothetical protein L0Y54_11655 [Sporichthyaceae bacterium]|nr:hypothetical protein [Sporichthyaceae bacterium]
MCDRIVLLGRGRFVMAEDLDQLKSQWKRIRVWNVEVPDDTGNWPGVVRVERVPGSTVLVVSQAADEIVRRLAVESGAVDIEGLSLRDIYLALERGTGPS